MSQQFIVVSRKNLQKPEEAPKFYALARSMRSVTGNRLYNKLLIATS